MLSNRYIALLRSQKVALACSGGVDSMVLLHLLMSYQIKPLVIHCHYGLRAKDADQDLELIRQTCDLNGLELVYQKFDTRKLATISGRSIEMEARHLRYLYFEELYQMKRYDYLLTAHHLDDDIETQWLRWIKGSALTSLRGIDESNQYIIRPLLSTPKSEILKYAETHNVRYRDDYTNQLNIYQRNQIRNQILPLAREINQSLAKSSQIIKQQSSELRLLLDDQCKHLISEWQQTGRVNLKSISNLNYKSLYLYHIFEHLGPNREQIATISRCLESNENKQIQIGDVWVTVKKCIVSKVNSRANEFFIAHSITELGDLLNTTIVDHLHDTPLIPGFIYLAINDIQWPLCIRSAESADMIKPLGMNGKKKISKILNERPQSNINPNQALIIEDSNQDILGIVGVCQSESTRIFNKKQSVIIIGERKNK